MQELQFSQYGVVARKAVANGAAAIGATIVRGEAVIRLGRTPTSEQSDGKEYVGNGKGGTHDVKRKWGLR